MKPVLVDTSVWRRHFAGRLSAEHGRWFGALLDEDGGVLVHPWVLGELVLGGLSTREEDLLALLPSVAPLEHHEVLGFVRQRGLARRGIGYIDAHLIGGALTAGATLWTLDRNLETVADELSVRFVGPQ
jgi:predicted nucleic acid-binding protein